MKKNDVELIQRILSGDETAFSDLVKKYQKSVHALAWRKIGDFHIAEEITQDTFLQAHKKLASLKNPNQFAGWLYVIADRLCKAWFRKKQLKKRLDMQSLEATSEETLEKTDYAHYTAEQREKEALEHQREIVQKLMEKLPESERTVMVLYYLGEMSCEEISKFLGVSPNTVKSRLQRARKHLRNQEHIISETLSGIQLPANLTENIMQQIAKLKEVSPQGGNRLPWAALASSTVLALLLIGTGTQLLTSFQNPYSFDAQSESTIEIVDAPIVLDIQSKPDLRNRVGNDTIPGKNSNNGLSTGTESMQNSIVQDTTQWNLPESAKARLGKGKIVDVQYSPDGKFLAVAGGIGIWIYDTTTHQEIALLTEHTSEVDSFTFAPDGHIIASGSVDGPITLWDRRTGALTTLTGHTDLVWCVVFSPDGKTLASDSRDSTIRLWNVITGEQKYRLIKDTKSANMLSFTPDGETLVSVSWENKITLWNSSTGEEKKTFPMHPDCSPAGVAFSPDGKTLAIGGDDNGTIYLYDLETGERKMTLTGHGDHVDNLAFSLDGKTLATSSHYDETIRLWDAHTGEHKLTLTEHARYVRGLAFSPDGKTLASGSGDGTIRFWDARTGKARNMFTGHSQDVLSVAFNPTGDFIASGSTNGIIRLWDVDTRQDIKTLNGSKDGFKDLARSMVFSPDGKTLVCGMDDGIRIWDTHTGEHKKTLTGHRDVVETVALSPDGKTLASGSWDDTIRIWDAHTGEHKKTLTEHKSRSESVMFSPDGKTLASGNHDNTIRLWDVDTGNNKMTLTGHTEWIRSIAFSPDGKTLASGGAEDIIFLWDIETGKTKMRLTGHKDWVYSLAFSPDGKTLASGCFDSTINLWDAHTGEYKKTLTGHTSSVNSIAFSPDGKTLVSGGRDGSVLIWEINHLNTTNLSERTLLDTIPCQGGHPSTDNNLDYCSPADRSTVS